MKKKPLKMLLKQANVQTERERNNFAKNLGITGVQMNVIDFLSNQINNQATQHEIERELDIRRSTTTVLVQGMEKRGLVDRIDNPNDGRQKLVTLTDKAQKLVPIIHEYVKKDDLALLDHFNKEEISNTEKILNFIRRGGSNE